MPLGNRVFPSPVVLLLLSFLLSLPWLLPNHNPPMTAFQAELLCGLALTVAGAFFLIKKSSDMHLPQLSGLFFLVALLPFGQFFAGLIHSFGTAWINSLYLFGFALAIVVSRNWEARSPGEVLDFLFLAIGIAGVVSVAMQLFQLLQVYDLGIWVLPGSGERFAANVHQPNMLGSLLLLGVVGIARAYASKRLSRGVAIGLIMYLLLGVALTESRTALLNVMLLGLMFSWGWHERRPARLNWILVGFVVYAILLQLFIPFVKEMLGEKPAVLRAISDPIRLSIWRESLLAVVNRPWWGYGWGQIREAYLLTNDLPETGGQVAHAHNFVLDILLYNGIVFGGVILIYLARFFVKALRNIRTTGVLFPFAAIMVLMVHASLELPLHYAYFLLPLGWFIGVVAQKIEQPPSLRPSFYMVLAVFFVWVAAGWVTALDCFEVERTFYMLRYKKGQPPIEPANQPHLYVLSQWGDRLEFINSDPVIPLSEDRYQWMKGVVLTTPSSYLYMRLAQNLALVGQVERSQFWLTVLCKVLPPDSRTAFGEEWLKMDEGAYKAVSWPGCVMTNSSVP